jgi:hypothetical protein
LIHEKRASTCVALVAGACLLLSAASSAHHGGAVEWGAEQLGPITGTATKFAFQFPHVYIAVDVAEEGVVSPWTLVTRWTPTILREHGWSRDSVKPGDKVTVTYLPHITTPRVGSIVSIEVNGQPLDIEF